MRLRWKFSRETCGGLPAGQLAFGKNHAVRSDSRLRILAVIRDPDWLILDFPLKPAVTLDIP